jgi:hypothetical protein
VFYLLLVALSWVVSRKLLLMLHSVRLAHCLDCTDGVLTFLKVPDKYAWTLLGLVHALVGVCLSSMCPLASARGHKA